MRNNVLIIVILSFFLLSADKAEENFIYFERIFPSYSTESEVANNLKNNANEKEVVLKAGNYYWLLGTSSTTQQSLKRDYCKKAVDILESYWKLNKKDNEITLSLGYAYTALAGCTPFSELEALLSSVNKAQNLFGMITARLPKNIDARLARTLINMNLTAQTGRPDALILEDVKIFFEGYFNMPETLQKHTYYYTAFMEMKLAQGLVYHDQGKKNEVKELLKQIDSQVLSGQLLVLFTDLKKKSGN